MGPDSGTIQPLCTHCSKIFPLETHTHFTKIEHYATAGELIREAASTSCALCAAIQQYWPLDEVRQRFQQDPEGVILGQTELQFSVDGGSRFHDDACETRSGEAPDQIDWILLSGELSSDRHQVFHSMVLVIATRDPRKIRYIWIDSLCIIQDDREEWRVEATRMKDVYASAWLTIAASSASDSSEGCFTAHNVAEFKDTDTYLQQVTQFWAAKSGSTVAGASTCHPVPNPDTPTQEHFAIRVYPRKLGLRTSLSKLGARGWTLQEHVLSRRIVHCTYPELHWQCQSIYTAEAGISILPSSPDLECIKTAAQVATTVEDQPQQDQSRLHGTYQAWCRWMEEYSSRHFTVPSDRLAALAGMVQWVAETTGYKHILGSWEETICEDLIWFGDPPHGHSEREAVLRDMPSWSWLSRSRNVVVGYQSWISLSTLQQVQRHARLIDTNIIWGGLPLVSSLLCAELQLRGPLKRMRLTTVPEARVFNPPYLNVNEDIRRRTGAEPIPWECAGGLDYQARDDEVDYLDGNYDCFHLLTAKMAHRTVEFFLVLEPVLRTRNSPGSEAHVSEQPTTDMPIRTFARIGLARFMTSAAAPSHFADAEDTIIRLI
ncbi:uncharacterized protein B0I36DRAFT_359869 [Microdochium trichocladiopsis]|uniref:Heterokaryon incompatibility domain-containing protein n=1 Tax=Microdochium trichocladiopsis TaxID=1682393 RepID=A0A9P8YFH5_9PEZI|nr:uncharacterized protein B0I36DRAFT_359869 [Microdochium trichocladiopsis]KAH7038284.1 hypothetical protein B0I36DRAFT_359869 [Microdochium trichocladiopsis]